MDFDHELAARFVGLHDKAGIAGIELAQRGERFVDVAGVLDHLRMVFRGVFLFQRSTTLFQAGSSCVRLETMIA